jgi:hypothetical protein
MNEINNITPTLNNVKDGSLYKSMTYEFWLPKCFWTSGKALHETPPRHVYKRIGVGGIYKNFGEENE